MWKRGFLLKQARGNLREFKRKTKTIETNCTWGRSLKLVECIPIKRIRLWFEKVLRWY